MESADITWTDTTAGAANVTMDNNIIRLGALMH